MNDTNNKYGWEIEKTPPFLVFRGLRKLAIEKFGESNVLDLSQGEPGYGFAPSTRSRRFFSFLMLIDTYLNNNQTDKHFGGETEKSFPNLDEKIKEIAFDNYKDEIASELLSDFDFFINKLIEISKDQNKPKNKFEILFDIFKYSILSGGRYPDSWGEQILRMAVANERKKEFGFNVSFEDILITNGASGGIGAFFKGFGQEGIGFLKPGDTVLMISPVYSPYTQFVEDRELNLVNISADTKTGKIDKESFETALNSEKRINWERWQADLCIMHDTG